MTDAAVSGPGRDAPPNSADWESTRASWRIEVPERFNAVIDILERWDREDPSALALVTIDGAGVETDRKTVSQLAADARRTAAALVGLGVKPGDPVYVMLPRIPEWYAAVLGAARMGAVPMPAPNMLTPNDIRYRIESSGAVVAITNAEAVAKVDEAVGERLAHRVVVGGGSGGAGAGWVGFEELVAGADESVLSDDPTSRDDPLLIYFTSGTVAYPKMVQHPHSYGLGHVPTARFWHDLRAGDLHWTVSDTGWAKAAYGGLFGQWHERATVVQVGLGKPDASTILGIIAEHGITSFCAPPTLYRLLVLADFSPFDLSRLRHCTSAGEPLNPEVIRAWRAGTGLTVYDGYGQTETTIVVANVPGMEVRPGSMGRPMAGWDVTVRREDGSPAPVGEVGEVCIAYQPERPVGLYDGYRGDEGATANAFRDGVYHTGDKAAVDEDGYFWFEGRNDDVITSSAYRIGPFEVESALVAHPAVAEAAVVGRDDPERTQIVCAFCILAPGVVASEELAGELQQFVKETTAPYKYPREVHFVDELPKTVSGKIRRTELRDWLREGRF